MYGHNWKEKIKPKTFCELIVEALEDFLLRMLIAAAIFSIVVNMATSDEDHLSIAWIEGFAILVAVSICVMITAGNNWGK